MTGELEFLISGMFFGLAAATSPGPLFALVFSETLKHSRREGIKIAFSPLIAEFPILLFVLLILSNLMEYGLIIGIISLFGACYLIHLGIKNMRVKTSVLEVESAAEEDGLKRGVIATLLNPNPYLFWFSIGGPMIFESLDIHISATVLFILGFYTLLVGFNISIVLIVDKSKSFIGSKYYLWVVRGLGIALILLALVFVTEGLKLMGIF